MRELNFYISDEDMDRLFLMEQEGFLLTGMEAALKTPVIAPLS